MLLLHFLELCIGDFNLWPFYIFDLLFLKAASPRHIGEAAAFFYGHKVPLKVASRVYAICNPNSAVQMLSCFSRALTMLPIIISVTVFIWHSISTFDAASFCGSTADIILNLNRSSLPILVHLISIAGLYDTIGCRQALRTPYDLICPSCVTKRPSI